jgi:superfamily I DNA and/or RNA helicase
MQLQTFVPFEQGDLKDYGLASLLQIAKYHPATKTINLEISYRFNPELCAVLSRTLYNNQLKCGAELKDRNALVNHPNRARACPVICIDVETDEAKDGKSYYNQGQIEAVLRIIGEHLRAPIMFKKKPVRIAVITFYSAMCERLVPEIENLKQRMRSRQEVAVICLEDSIPAQTVDAFQGREEDITIVATVRTSMNKINEFAMNAERGTVALTRSKQGFFLVGHMNHLIQREGPFGDFVREVLE